MKQPAHSVLNYALAGIALHRGELDRAEQEIRQQLGKADGTAKPRRVAANGHAPAPKVPKARQRPKMTASQRKAVSARMKKYWSERRKTKSAAPRQ